MSMRRARWARVPVLVTPLTRRSFKGDYLKDDLAPWAGDHAPRRARTQGARWST